MGSLPILLVIEMGLLIYPLQKIISKKGMRKLRDATLMILVCGQINMFGFILYSTSNTLRNNTHYTCDDWTTTRMMSGQPSTERCTGMSICPETSFKNLHEPLIGNIYSHYISLQIFLLFFEAQHHKTGTRTGK